MDLVISLEVAEHLTPEAGQRLVDRLCGLSDLILFSAAIPGQGGTNHINERWQSEWAELFAQYEYRAFDIVRPKIWDDERIASYYRQNMIVYARRGTKADKILKSKFSGVVNSSQLNMVHPEIYERLYWYRQKVKNRWYRRSYHWLRNRARFTR